MNRVYLFQKSPRKAFWRPDGAGYTQDRSQAGLFDEHIANEIVSRPKTTTRIIAPGELFTTYIGMTCDQIAEALP